MKEINLNKIVIGVSLIASLIVVLLFRFLPPEVPIFYGKATGSEQLAPTYMLIFPFVLTILISLLNMFLSKKVARGFLSQSLSASSVIVCLLSIVTVFKIILLVGFF